MSDPPVSSPPGWYPAPGGELAAAPDENAPAAADAELARDSRPSNRSGALGLTVAAIALAIVGLIATAMSVMLTDQNQSFGVVSAMVPWVAIGSTLGAVVLGIVLLERRARGRAVLAVAVGVSAIGSVVTVATLVPLPDLEVHVYGYACPYYVTSLANEIGRSSDQPLPYGSSVAESAAMEEQPWTTFTVEKPIDVTETARKAGLRLPRSGTYFAVPVTRGVVDDSGMKCKNPLKTNTYWVSGSEAQAADIPLSLPGYPGGEQGGRANDDGTVTYYVIFDITPESAASGAFALSQMTSYPSDPPLVFWGSNPSAPVITAPDVAAGESPGAVAPSPDATAAGGGTRSSSTDVYVAAPNGPGSSYEVPLPYGTAQTMQSVAKGTDALKLVVNSPVDITTAAREAGAGEPKNGSYIAVPITATEIDTRAIVDTKGVTQYPDAYWVTADGTGLPQTVISVPSYPVLSQVDSPSSDGTWSYYMIYDAPPESLNDGLFALSLKPPGGGDQYWWWGEPSP